MTTPIIAQIKKLKIDIPVTLCKIEVFVEEDKMSDPVDLMSECMTAAEARELKRAAAKNPWKWGVVEVFVSYGRFSGSDIMSAITYDSLEDFKAGHGLYANGANENNTFGVWSYYADMVNNAHKELISKIEQHCRTHGITDAKQIDFKLMAEILGHQK